MHCSHGFERKREILGEQVTDFSFLMHVLLKLYHMHMMHSAQEIGLSGGQPHILMSLSAKNLQTQKELADFIRIQPASMTDILKRMERDELVERIRDENDLRSIRVSITEKGREKVHAFFEKEASLDDIGLRGFSAEEKEACIHFLKRILDNMNEDRNEKRGKT